MKALNNKASAVLVVPGVPLLLLFTLAGCSRGDLGARRAESRDPVQIGVAVNKDVPIQVRATGYVTPFASIAVKSGVDGKLERALFNEGDEVKRGETILVVDSRLLESALRQAEANLRRDEAMIASAEAEAHRNEVLFKEGLVPAELAEQTRAAADASKATVAADKIAVENAQLQLSFCRIASPIDGRVGKLLADVGTLIRNNETVLAMVNQTRPVYVDFPVPEEELPVIQKEMPNGQLNVVASIPGKASESATGKVVFIDNTADRATAMIPLRARFANDDEALWPGETVNVTLTLATLTNAVVVPSSAVQVGPTGRYLLVVKPDFIVERRPVVISERVASETIIKSGIEAGERLISSGQERVTPGKRIKIHSLPGNSLAKMP